MATILKPATGATFNYFVRWHNYVTVTSVLLYKLNKSEITRWLFFFNFMYHLKSKRCQYFDILVHHQDYVHSCLYTIPERNLAGGDHIEYSII